MGLGTDHIGQTANTIDSFQQTLITNRILENARAALVAANVFEDVTPLDEGGENYVLSFPTSAAFTAQNKAVGSQVTLQSPADTDIDLTFNTHKEASLLIEDITKGTMKAKIRIDRYIDDAGYSVAKALDTSILSLYSSLTLTTEAATSDTGDNLYNHIVEAMLKLDRGDVPRVGRVAVIHPVLHARMLQIASSNLNPLISRDYRNPNPPTPVDTGFIGNFMGIDWYVSNNVPYTTASSVNTYQSVVGHRSMFAYAYKWIGRYQMQYMQEYLGTMHTIDSAYGIACLYPARGLTLTCTGAA